MFEIHHLFTCKVQHSSVFDLHLFCQARQLSQFLNLINEDFAAANGLHSFNLSDLLRHTVLSNVEVNWRILEIAQLRNLVVDVRAHKFKIICKAMLLEFT